MGMDVGLAGEGKTLVLTQESRTAERVTAVGEDGSADIEVVHEAIRFSAPALGVTWDSERPDGTSSQDPQVLGFKALLGGAFTAHVLADGHVERVEGVNELVDKMFMKLPGVPLYIALKKATEGSVNDENMREGLERSYLVRRPSRPLAVGDSWEDVRRATVQGVELTTRYRSALEAIEPHRGRECARIISTGVGDPVPSAMAMPLGVQVRVESYGSKWLGYVDLETGQVVEGTSTVEIRQSGWEGEGTGPGRSSGLSGWTKMTARTVLLETAQEPVVDAQP